MHGLVPILDRIDPEVRAVVERNAALDLRDLAAARALYAQRMATMSAAPPRSDVERLDLTAPGRDGGPAVRLRLFRPAGVGHRLPALYWIPGGGYVLPGEGYAAEHRMDDQCCSDLALRNDCAVVSVAWRAAPEHPFPAAIEDCYAGLAHVVATADELRVDRSRIVIGGYSSGGGSAAGVALLVRDRAELEIAHQLLIYPMLDDRDGTASTRAVTDAQVWNRETNRLAWRAYLGASYGTDAVSPYAAPSRMEDLSGSIPASVLTAELDLFRDEDVLYAMRLMEAGVPTELHVYPAAPHSFDRYAPRSTVAKRFFADRDAILRRVFGAA
jgi:acetyl esterase/lipase